MDDVGEGEEEGLRTHVVSVVLGAEFIPILFNFLNGGDLGSFDEVSTSKK
jgi:hypothetical protein